MTSEDLRQALQRPDAYPGEHVDAVALCETHISWVFLVGTHAYKLKKPLVTSFLDYGTAARRRELCHEEVRLNSRLAPDIYLGVLGVVLDGTGAVRLVDEQAPDAIDYVVQMRRFDERATLAAKLARGEVRPADITAVAQVLARFHAAAPVVRWREGPVLAVERRFEQNAHELLAGERTLEQLGRILGLERFAHAWVGAHAAMLEARARRGCVRDVHGDIRAEHVVFEQGVEIVDCIEFAPALRELDIADDLAFLVFDLAARGSAELGDQLVDAYRVAGGDAGPPSLIAFYAAHRALVRAKVALLRAEQEDRDERATADAAQASGLIELAERFAWRARLPLLIVVCGPPASGKSHLATNLTRASGLPGINSDETRKRLAGLSPHQRAPAAAYTGAFNARTYAELGTLASAALENRGGAIVDATFRHPEDRHTFLAALRAEAPTLVVECRAPPAVLAARAHARRHDAHQASDADVDIVLRERAAWQPLDDVVPESHIILRTDRPDRDIIADLLALLDRRLGRIGPLRSTE